MNGSMNFQPNPQNQSNQNQQNFQLIPNWNMPTTMPIAMWPWMFYGNMMKGGQNSWNPNQDNNPTPNNQNQQNAQQNQEQTDQTKAPSRQFIPCGIISDPKEIKPGDVPMDGSIGMFIQNDLSAIYVKQWNSEGAINTKKYIIDPSEINEASFDNPMDQVNERFERIESAISNLVQTMNAQTKKTGSQKNNQKMEGVNNE